MSRYGNTYICIYIHACMHYSLLIAQASWLIEQIAAGNAELLQHHFHSLRYLLSMATGREISLWFSRLVAEVVFFQICEVGGLDHAQEDLVKFGYRSEWGQGQSRNSRILPIIWCFRLFFLIMCWLGPRAGGFHEITDEELPDSFIG